MVGLSLRRTQCQVEGTGLEVRAQLYYTAGVHSCCHFFLESEQQWSRSRIAEAACTIRWLVVSFPRESEDSTTCEGATTKARCESKAKYREQADDCISTPS